MKSSPSRTIWAKLFEVIGKTSKAYVCSVTRLRPQQVSNWTPETPSFNAKSFDALMEHEEIRSALVARLRELPEENVQAWEDIGAKLSKTMSPVLGWKLANAMVALKSMGVLEKQIEAMEIFATADKDAAVKQAKLDKLAARLKKLPGQK